MCLCVLGTHFLNHVANLQEQFSCTVPLEDKLICNLIISYNKYGNMAGVGNLEIEGRFTHIMPFRCRAHAVPPPYRAAKGLECVFPIWFTQCGSVWFTPAMPCSDNAVLLKATTRPCFGVALRRTAWSEHGMAGVNQTRPPQCVNQMGKKHSKPLGARHGRGTACCMWIGLKSQRRSLWSVAWFCVIHTLQFLQKRAFRRIPSLVVC